MSRRSFLPACAAVVGIVPSAYRGCLASRGSVRREVAERWPSLGSVSCLLMRASGFACYGGREPGRRRRQQSSPRGARWSSGVRRWTGDVRAMWTGGRYFRYRPPLGSSGTVGSNTSSSDQLGVAVSGTVVQVSTAVGASAARRRGVAGAGARRRSRTSESRERDGQAAGFGGCPRARPHSPRRRLRRRPLGAAVRSTPSELCSPSGDLFF